MDDIVICIVLNKFLSCFYSIYRLNSLLDSWNRVLTNGNTNLKMLQPCAFDFVKCLSMLCLTDIINICFSSAGTTEIHLYSAVYDSITNNDTCLTGRYWLVLYKATPLIMEWLKVGIVHMISWMKLIVLVLDGIFLARKLKKILHPEEMELN